MRERTILISFPKWGASHVRARAQSSLGSEKSRGKGPEVGDFLKACWRVMRPVWLCRVSIMETRRNEDTDVTRVWGVGKMVSGSCRPIMTLAFTLGEVGSLWKVLSRDTLFNMFSRYFHFLISEYLFELNKLERRRGTLCIGPLKFYTCYVEDPMSSLFVCFCIISFSSII